MTSETSAAQRGFEVWSATPTPFKPRKRGEKLEPNFDDIPALVQQHQRLGVDGVFLFGTCGEGTMMTPQQKRQFLVALRSDCLPEHYSPQISVQVTDTSYTKVIENMEVLLNPPIHAIPVIAPPETRFRNPQYVEEYYDQSIAWAAQRHIPVGIYIIDYPGTPEISVELWHSIISKPVVSLVKNSSPRQEISKMLLHAVEDRIVGGIMPQLKIYTGHEFDVVDILAYHTLESRGITMISYDGAVLGGGILIAGMIREAIETLNNGSIVDAERMQDRVNKFLEDLYGPLPEIPNWLRALKNALVQANIFSSDELHLAYHPLTAEEEARVARALAREKEFIGKHYNTLINCKNIGSLRTFNIYAAVRRLFNTIYNSSKTKIMRDTPLFNRGYKISIKQLFSA